MAAPSSHILTTHVGSLPRPHELNAWVARRASGETLDEKEFDARLREAVAQVVRQQAEAGLDIVDDGEYGKTGFVSYVNGRLGGLAPDASGRKPIEGPWSGSREAAAFPEFYRTLASAQKHGSSADRQRMVCVGPISYVGQAELSTQLDGLKRAVRDVGVCDAFVPAVSPSNIEGWQRNQHYKTDEEFLFAIAEAMREEYCAIIEAGFLLQIDDSRLATHYVRNPNLDLKSWARWAEPRIEALNHALRDLPQARIRFHACHGINMGPRVHDMPLRDYIALMLKVKAGAYAFEAANPRHEHEWEIWREIPLPDDKSIIPGCITHTSFLVEHPELVEQRILRFASVVGRERVIAGADCGFASFSSSEEIHPTIVWAKFKALAEGAQRATDRLWPRKRSATA